MTLGLVMIVRNEAHGIADTLASVRSIIDHWTILDTGSTDGTQDVVRRELDGIPGTLHEEPFIDFAASRNRALELHGASTTFTLMLDSDDRVGGANYLKEFLDGDDLEYGAFLVERRGETSWWMPLVLRTEARWRYTGRVHECVAGPQGQIATSRVPVTSITQVRGARSVEASLARWQRDLELLKIDKLANPRNPRTSFYLAQTYECLGKLEAALLEYAHRVDLGGWRDEVFEAKLRIAKILHRTHRTTASWPTVQQAYLDAYAYDPSRAEPLVELAEHWRLAGNMACCYLFAAQAAALPMPASGLFVDRSVYEWRAADLMAISAYYVGGAAIDPGRRAAEIAARARPEDQRLATNRTFYEGVE